jgi:hypothetical protein
LVNTLPMQVLLSFFTTSSSTSIMAQADFKDIDHSISPREHSLMHQTHQCRMATVYAPTNHTTLGGYCRESHH